MTTIAELVDTEPAATAGVTAGFEYGTGTWRHVVELADPAAGTSVEWFDITEWFTGSEYNRGADGYLGRYRASVATLDLFAPDDRFAPWNEDTSDTFGVNVSLGPGLLIRSGFILVDGGVVTDWNPRFTLKVEFWGDASYSQGKIRQHRIVARDTLTSLVGVPIGASTEENWSDRVDHVLTEAGWEYGYTLYGATTIGGVGILPLPDRDAQASAINELDATVDPAGCCWYTNRKGQLIVRPTVYDTWQASKFDPGGAAGTPYPEPGPVTFAWWSCSDEEPPGDYGDLDTETTAAYGVDTRGVDPFGIDRSEQSIINHVVVTSPSGTFDDDDPTSIQRYDRHTMQASWITANDFVAADILAARANATLEARPLTTTLELTRFHPGPAVVDYLDDIAIWHRNGVGLEVNADGWVRSYRELVRPRGCDTVWELAITFDVETATSRNPFLLPVVNLELTAVTELAATFAWENPTQVIDPTHTQIRMLNPTSDWTTTAYPITGVVWSGLAPYTAYEFQVRLIRVDDTIITHFSPTRSVIFITDAPDDPYVVPPDTPGGDADVTFPPPDDPEDCILEWELQSSPDGTTWTTEDDGEITEPPYTLTYDTTGLDDELFWRFRSREVCGGVPGPWHDSDPFVINCLPVSRLADPPYDDANLVAYWPQVCNTTVEEAVSDEPMTFGGAFDRVDFDSAGRYVLHTFGQGVIGSGVTPNPVAGSSDLTISCRVNFGELPDGEVIIFGANGLYFSAETSGSGYVIYGQVYEAGTGIITIGGGPTVLALGTEYDLSLTHDVGGTLSLYIDGTLEDASVATIDARSNTLGLYSIGAPADSWVTDCAVWDRVLVPSDLPGFVPRVEFVAAGAANDTTTGSLSLALPAGLAVGDIVLAAIVQAHVGGNAQSPVPTATGWLPYPNAGGSGTTDDNELHVLGRRIDGTESSPVTFTCSAASGRASGRIVGFTGVSPHYLIGTNDGTTDDFGDSTTHTPDSLTGAEGDMSVAIFGGNGGNTTTPTLNPDQGYTDAGQFGAFETNFNRHGRITYKQFPAAGTMTACTFDHGYTCNGDTINIRLPGAVTGIGSLDSAILALNPVGYWRLDETAGTTAADSSGNARTGTYAGTYTLNSITGADGAPVALFTDGRVTIGDNAAFDRDTAPGLTIFALVRPTTTTGTRRFIITKARSAPAYDWQLTVDATNGRLGFASFCANGATRSLATTATGVLVANQWNAVVASVASGVQNADIKLFADGVVDISGTESSTENSALDNAGDVWIGDRADLGADQFLGYIARVAIFAGVVDTTSLMQAMVVEGW